MRTIPDDLGLPLIVKPAREGSSIGVAKVQGYSEMADAVDQAAALDADVLCEQFVSGDEVTCPVLGTGDSARALPVIRIVAPEGNYDYQNKYFTDDTKYLVPCGLPEGEEQVIQEIVLKAYRVLGCRGWGRLDVMIDAATRQPSLLEINTSPGMTGHSLVPMSARAAGISYEDLCLPAAGFGGAGPGAGGPEEMSSALPTPFDVKLMNLAATALFSAFFAALLAAGVWWALRNPVFAIAGITVQGDVTHNSAATLRANVAPRLAGNFFTVNLDSAREAFESVPWVRKAVVRREFPNRLRVRLEEHRAVALWGGDGDARLVNSFGEVFEANVGDVEADELPRLAGPDDQSAQVLAMYRDAASRCSSRWTWPSRSWR